MDRRKHRRFDLALAMRVISPPPASDGACLMLNVSRSGVAFLSERELPCGEPVEYEFSYPARRKGKARVAVRCTGKIVRVEPLRLGYRLAATLEAYEMRRERALKAAGAGGAWS